VFTDSLQHIDQIGMRIDIMQPAGDQQALYNANLFSPDLGPGAQPIFTFMQSFA
jgi:hypothetical protein